MVQLGDQFTLDHFNVVLAFEFDVNSQIITDAAEIVSHPVDQVVWVGQQVTLFCDALGNPVPNITYSIFGDNGTVSFGRTLVIGASNIPYVKSYTCTADNGLEAPVFANVTVTVLGKSRLISYFATTDLERYLN